MKTEKNKRGRKPGTPKTGGRQVGTPNKATAETRAWINSVIEDNKERFVENLAKLEPERHVQLIEKLLAYTVPKPQNFDIQIEYHQLEALLERTPEEYIERITAKLHELHLQTVESKQINE